MFNRPRVGRDELLASFQAAVSEYHRRLVPGRPFTNEAQLGRELAEMALQQTLNAWQASFAPRFIGLTLAHITAATWMAYVYPLIVTYPAALMTQEIQAFCTQVDVQVTAHGGEASLASLAKTLVQEKIQDKVNNHAPDMLIDPAQIILDLTEMANAFLVRSQELQVARLTMGHYNT